MDRVTAIWDREPVAILAVVEVIIAAVVAFGLDLTGEQVAAVVSLSAALLGVTARANVTPMAGVTYVPTAALTAAGGFVAGDDGTS